MVDVKKELNPVPTDKVEKKVKKEKTLIQRIESSFRAKNPLDEKNTKESLTWYRQYISKNITNVRLPQILEDKSFRQSNTLKAGAMCMFQYDPMNKETLPFYDTMPLIFPVSVWKSSEGHKILSGINLHYLPPLLRQKIFLVILDMQRTKNLNWNVLKKIAESKLFEHALKNYRMDYMMSRFIIVPEDSMELVLFLPLARFKKGSAKQAWRI